MFSEVSIMLLQFRVKNYRSIGDEITIDFTAGGGRELSHFLIEKNKVKILPVVSLYGSNASGKSNIIDALQQMFRNIANSHTYGENHGFLTVPFLYDASQVNKPTEFELFFVMGRYEYQYGFIASVDKVYEEWLYRQVLSVNETKQNSIFVREGDNIQFAKPYAKFENLTSVVGKKNLALSFLGYQEAKEAKIFNDIYDWISSIFRVSPDWTDIEFFAGMYYEDEARKKFFLDFISEFDPLIEDIQIEREMNKNGETEFRVFTQHNGEKYPLYFESFGTRKLFSMCACIATILNVVGGAFICDELDSHLHPLILRRIVRMFHDKNTNKTNAQLIFTSHNMIVLDNQELRRDEIWFVEKDNRGYTNTYSLDSFKTTKNEIRADMSYGKNYLAGRFGAIPYTKPNGDK